MRTIKVSALSKQLQALADQVGAKRFNKAKALMLNGLIITDEQGNVVSPDNISYEITLTPEEVEKMSEDAPADKPFDPAIFAEEEEDEELKPDLAKTVASEVRKALASNGTSPRKAVAPSVSISSPRQKSRHFKSAETAYRFGRWAMASLGRADSQIWCKDHGVLVTKGQTEGTNSAGGFLVPDEFSADIISLREEYGVFRQNAAVKPMAGDTLYQPRRIGNLTAYAAGEAQAGTESSQTFDRIQLVAKKFIVISTVSNELNEDNAVSFGDDLAKEIAYAFSNKEDDCGFNGTGTSTYNGIVGASTALSVAAGGVYTASGIVKAPSGETTMETLTLATMRKVIGRLPAYADRGNAKWYCHKYVANTVMERIAEAAGGVTANEVRDGSGQLRFLGYPVVYAQSMPKDIDTALPQILFGDLAMAAYLGDRRGLAVAFSDSALNAFEQDEVAVRGTARFDINNANYGSSSEAGAVVGVIAYS